MPVCRTEECNERRIRSARVLETHAGRMALAFSRTASRHSVCSLAYQLQLYGLSRTPEKNEEQLLEGCQQELSSVDACGFGRNHDASLQRTTGTALI